MEVGYPQSHHIRAIYNDSDAGGKWNLPEWRTGRSIHKIRMIVRLRPIFDDYRQREPMWRPSGELHIAVWTFIRVCMDIFDHFISFNFVHFSHVIAHVVYECSLMQTSTISNAPNYVRWKNFVGCSLRHLQRNWLVHRVTWSHLKTPTWFITSFVTNQSCWRWRNQQPMKRFK